MGHLAVAMSCRYVRIWDEEDEALQPEWEIDPKDLQILEKVRPAEPITLWSFPGVLFRLYSGFNSQRFSGSGLGFSEIDICSVL